MNQPLLPLTKQLEPTRDYLREVALGLGSLQRGFLPAEKHLWQHGLEVNMRGPITQSFELGDREVRASLDLVKYKVRFLDAKWALHEYAPPEIWQELKKLVHRAGAEPNFDEPEFKDSVAEFDTAQADAYAAALWWFDEQFRGLKAGLNGAGGLTSPILLYPHHFDLALSWFPWADERQLTIGWSTGDQTIPEPYVYLTAYPEPKGFTAKTLPKEAYWQKDGFSGAVIAYAALHASSMPEQLLQQFAEPLFAAGHKLLG